MTDPNRSHSLNMAAARASLGVALVLIALKLWAFYATGALSIAASLADSALDLIMSSIALLAVSYASRPPDEDHTFGHNSAEDLTALLQSIFLLIAAIGLVVTGLGRLFADEPPRLEAEGLGVAVMLVSMALTLGLVIWQGYVSKRTSNKVIAADRLHYLADLLPAIGSIIALVANKFWGFWQLDPIMALISAAILVKGALSIGREAWDALMDRRADPKVLEGVAALASSWPGVLGWHDLRSRTSGSRIFMHLHIELDGDQSLRDAHEIGKGLRRAILEAYPQADIIIHKDIACDKSPPQGRLWRD